MHMTEVQERQSFIFSFDMTEITAKFAEEHNLSEEIAKKYETELKKYFLLRVVQKRRYGMNGLSDDLWHKFILSTRKYTDFCNQAFGTYLHHEPAEQSGSPIPKESIMYLRFLVDYFRYYGIMPPDDIWPFSDELFGDAPEWKLQAVCIAPCLTRCS
jgi:hypothetical protein